MAEWAFVKLEANTAQLNGMPEQIPVPKEEFEGLAEKGLDGGTVRRWIQEFMQATSGSWRQQNNELASRYDAFLAKGPHWDKAQKAFQKGDTETAIKALKMITRVDRQDGAAKLNLGMALAAAGQYPEALELFNSLAPIAKRDADFHVAKANVELALADKEAAIESFVSALEAKPDCKPAMDGLVQLGVLVRVYDDPKDAGSLTYVRSDSVASYFQELWASEPRSAAYYLEQLGYHELEKRWALVIAAAEIILAEHAGEQDRAASAKVAALRASGEASRAQAEAEEYLASHPSSVPVLVELARCLGRESEAGRAQLDRALELDPGDQLALSLRFWPESEDDLQALHQALPAISAFAEAHPESAGCARNLGRAQLRLGNDELALELFQKAISLAPEDDDLRSEYWAELGRLLKWESITQDAQGLGDLSKRSWLLRWSEAEAYAALGKQLEARAAFTAIAQDESLLVDIRKRAKRAVQRIAG